MTCLAKTKGPQHNEEKQHEKKKKESKSAIEV